MVFTWARSKGQTRLRLLLVPIRRVFLRCTLVLCVFKLGRVVVFGTSALSPTSEWDYGRIAAAAATAGVAETDAARLVQPRSFDTVADFHRARR